MITEPIELVVGPNEEGNSQFGQLMQKMRDEALLSRQYVANSMELSSEYIRLIERGLRVPAFGSMPKFLKLYGVDFTHYGAGVVTFDGICVRFTSRIQESRRGSDDPPLPRVTPSSDRSRLIGQIVEQLTQADTETLRYIYHTLIRS